MLDLISSIAGDILNPDRSFTNLFKERRFSLMVVMMVLVLQVLLESSGHGAASASGVEWPWCCENFWSRVVDDQGLMTALIPLDFCDAQVRIEEGLAF
jgi:hypothetical protein